LNAVEHGQGITTEIGKSEFTHVSTVVPCRESRAQRASGRRARVCLGRDEEFENVVVFFCEKRNA
jgi:hypothetical protein